MEQVKCSLYKLSSKGVLLQWKVYITGAIVTVEHGQVAGKLQSKDTICKGKNVGRSNETTDEQQALSEAESKWAKQIKKGYVESSSGESDIRLPQKVESYFDGKMKDKVVFPCTSSPKLDGVNGECRLLKDGSFVQLSRGGEVYPSPAHKAKVELLQVMAQLGVDSLNYEIYLHGEWLQDLQGAVKAPHNHGELHSKLEYHIFDLPTHGGDWKERRATLANADNLEFVKIIPSVTVTSHEEVISRQDGWVALGYEGTILNNFQGVYTYNSRSQDVLKVKYVQSSEFLIDSYLVDKNNQPVFICKVEGGQFKVKPKGTKYQRAAILELAEFWIGGWMTVEFEKFSKDGKPLKPVGIGLREGRVVDGKFIPTE